MKTRTVDINFDDGLLNPTYRPYLDDNTPLQIMFGGSSSGKSVFCSQRCVYDLLKGGRNYLIARNVGKSIRGSVFNEIKKVIFEWELNKYFNIHKTDFTITNTLNGYQTIFTGLDDAQKIKSITPEKGVFTDIWIEEATETKYDDHKELIKRLRGTSREQAHIIKRMMLSFNPIMKTHWIFKEHFAGMFFDEDTVYRDEKKLILKTTYKDNDYLTEQDKQLLEDETNEYFYQVYTLGNWGVLGDLVFNNWSVEDLSEVKDMMGVYKNGLDFGFTNDPSAGIRSSMSDDTIYITHCFHEYGATNDVIADFIRQTMPLTVNGIESEEKILADNNYPKDIWDLKHEYNINIYGANKRPGSVNSGINWLKKYKIVIHKELQEAINEFQMYQWSKNKDGEALNIPIDKFNHLIDALRYAWSEQSLNLTQEEEYDLSAYGIPG